MTLLDFLESIEVNNTGIFNFYCMLFVIKFTNGQNYALHS